MRTRPHKYGAVATEVDNIRFASKLEARRYGELKLLEKAGEITAGSLTLQPKYALHTVTPAGEIVKVATYIADFKYISSRGGHFWVTEDAKGVRTPVYRLKKRWVEAQYGIEVIEV